MEWHHNTAGGGGRQGAVWYRYKFKLVSSNLAELARQEERNLLDEELYKVRDQVQERENSRFGELLAAEEATQRMRSQLDELEAWLYNENEGEVAPTAAFTEARQQLAERARIYAIWCDKFVVMKAKEEERRRFIEQQGQGRDRNSRSGERQIPVVYEGREGGYVPKSGEAEAGGVRRSDSGRPHSFDSGSGRRRGAAGGTFPRVDPFRGFGTSEFFDPMFGW